MNSKKLKTMILIALFGAISYGVMLLEVPTGYLGGALKLDPSLAVVTVGGVLISPLAVLPIALIKSLLHFIIQTTTGGVGELADFIIAAAFALP